MCQNMETDLVKQARCLGVGCRVWVYPTCTQLPAVQFFVDASLDQTPAASAEVDHGLQADRVG